MNLFKKLHPLDVTAGTALVVLVFMIAGVIAYNNWLGVGVTLHTNNPLGQVSPYETLTLTFSQPVRPNDVENQLELQPATSGNLEWQDDRTAHFIPSQPFQGNFTVHLAPGKLGASGEWLRKDAAWQLTVRPPLIVYWNYGEPKYELMVVSASGGTPRQLTSTSGNVYDFAVSRTGDEVAYSLLNAQKGLDLWIIARDGKNPRRLLDCGANRCSVPAWSPDGKSIAYNYEAAGLTANSPTGAPRLWIVDVQTSDKRPVFADSQTIGYSASWSPDGNWLASYDGVSGKIRVVNIASGQQVLLPSALGRLGSWSPDSAYLLYPNVLTGQDGKVKTFLYRADFQSGEIGIFLGKTSDENDYAYDAPAWSPLGNQIVLSLRPDPQKPERQLWVIRPETLGGPIIAKEPGYTYDFYQWDPWGANLVIQQASLTKTYIPEAAVWNPVRGLQVIAQNALFPHWLP